MGLIPVIYMISSKLAILFIILSFIGLSISIIIVAIFPSLDTFIVAIFISSLASMELILLIDPFWSIYLINIVG